MNKDVIKAYFLFEKAANLGDSDAQFNLGSILLFDLSKDIRSDQVTGFKYITLSAQQGHLGALYALGLSYLDGSDLYSTCETAAKLFAVVTERGPWNSYLKGALEYYEI